eukprot:s2993_g8.t1
MLYRQRYTFQEFLKLCKPQEMKTDQDDAAILDAARQVPMANERPITWTVQKEDDVATRQPLPDWLSRPVERAVTWWSSENRKWQAKIDARAELGKGLTASAEAKYAVFVKEKSTMHLLFSKKTRKQVLRLQSTKELERKEKDLFSVELIMSSDPSKLAIRGGSGEARRLALVKSEAMAPDELPELPDFIGTGGVASSVVDALVVKDTAGDDEHEEGDADDLEGDGDQENDEQEDMEIDAEEQECMEMADAIEDESDKEEILYYSSEEETVKASVSSNFNRVKSFDHRPEWKALSARGATEIPPNYFIGYHATSRTWQGYFGESGGGSGQRLTIFGEAGMLPRFLSSKKMMPTGMVSLIGLMAFAYNCMQLNKWWDPEELPFLKAK